MTESRHRLGFAVKVLGDGGLPSHDTRRWQSGPHLRHSLERLDRVLDYLVANDIRMYRVATALAPYASHPELSQFHGQVAECVEQLAAVGELVRARDIRLSSHPRQYTVLNSESERVRAAAVADLEVQAALFDAMGLADEAVIVLHLGGAAGGKSAACDRFLAGFELLSDAAQRRLVVENDDRSFGIGDVFGLSQRTGLKVVLDIHHHHCNDPDGVSDREALALALGTWPTDVTPKIHYSSPRSDKFRPHADLVDANDFERLMREVGGERDLDVMLEVKAKDVALLTLRAELSDAGLESRDGRLMVSA